jgi:hypothetical protein
MVVVDFEETARQASLPRVGFLSDEMTTTDDN